ncbi:MULTISPECIES: universal stress protein [Haloferacaceae]|uniref:Universal stress protein n=1 Tax=Halorubrum glutamatedens TaxID=2707018 RepID=A0ABD5QWC6_9EURY|nr:universal stress protein [Halobellus captivus]
MEHLVAMDDSPLARESLVYALEVFTDARVTIVHVAYPELDMLSTDIEEVYGADPAELDGVGDETARNVFETIRDVVDDRSVAVTYLLGEADRRLVEYVQEGSFDHVVMGTHGRDGLSRLLIGSVAEAVVRRTDVPTTLVK